MASMFRRKSSQNSSDLRRSPSSPSAPVPSLPPLTRPSHESPEGGGGVFSDLPADLTRSPSLGKAKVLESALPLSSAFHRPSSSTSPRAGAPPGGGGGLTKSPSMPTWTSTPHSPQTGSSHVRGHSPIPPGLSDASGGGSFKSSPSLNDLRTGRADGGRRSIASLYPTTASNIQLLPSKSPEHQPGGNKTHYTPSIASSSMMPKSASLPNVRRAQRVPPTLNILITGAARTGKTGFIRTLFRNTKPAGGVNMVQEARNRVEAFGMGARGEVRRTKEVAALTVDVMEKNERFTFTAIDTPGMNVGLGDVRKGDEVEVDRQLRETVRMIEDRFQETLELENQVIRHSQRAHDNHLHLAIYFIDPLSIAPRPSKSRSRIQIAAHSAASKPNGSPVKTASSLSTAADDEESWELGMSDFDLRAIAKLAKRINVLPVIGRADELTVARLEEVKRVVKRDLRRAGISWGAFVPNEEGAISSGGTSATEDGKTKRRSRVDSHCSHGSSSGHDSTAKTPTAAEAQPPLPDGAAEAATPAASADVPAQEEEVEPVKLIRVRSRSRGGLGRSVSRRVLVQEESEEEEEEEELKSYAEFLPFALVAPDEGGKSGGNADSGRFVREFKHGTVDVLNPDHSDFLLLRDALLSSIMKPLKDSTRLEKYEPYRTERLLSRKAVASMPEEQRSLLINQVAQI